MKRFRGGFVGLVCCLLAIALVDGRAHAAEMTADQKDAVSKLQAKGGLGIPVAANTDALVGSLATPGKSAGDAELALVKVLPNGEQLHLRRTGITDNGRANIECLPPPAHP